MAGEGALDLSGVVARLAGGEVVADRLDTLGWQEGVFRQFTCDPPPGHVGWVDLSVHAFPDAESAAEAVSAFAATRAQGTNLKPAKAFTFGERNAALAGPTVNGTEYTLYLSRGPLLFALTGVAPDGDPRADVEAIAVSLATTNAPSQIGEAPTPTPYALGASETAPTPVSLPTATPLPTPTMPPPPTTIVPTPTAVPTATPVPTEPPPPEAPPLIPVAVPTTAPPTLPTPTAGPLPTPTPRVIRPPTPAAA
jgi:hypothetical protein